MLRGEAGHSAKAAALARLVIGAAFLFAAVAIVFRSIQHLPEFDDEGTLLIGFRLLADGAVLYDEVYSFYGPAYYLIYRAAFLALPIVHDSARVLTALALVATVMGGARLVFVATGSRLAAAFAAVIGTTTVAWSTNSPIHPEQLCLLLIIAWLLLFHRLDTGVTAGRLLLIGAVIGAALLVKINVGVFLGAATALAVTGMTGAGPWLRALRWLLFACAASMAPILMASLIHLDWVVIYCAAATTTILIAAAFWIAIPQPPLFQPRHWFVIGAGFALALGTILAAMLYSGTSFGAFLDLTVLQTGRFIRNWQVMPNIGFGGVIAAAASAISAAFWWHLRNRARGGEAAERFLILVKLVVGLGTLGAMHPIYTFWIMAPFAWIVMAPGPDGARPFPVLRTAIGLLVAIFALYAFPVAGHQTAIGSFPAILLMTIAVHDAYHAAARRWGIDQGARKPAAILGYVVALELALLLGVREARIWLRSVPLDLPGTSLIRLPESEATALRATTAYLSNCGAFYSVPGLMSFHFWTGYRPPTTLNTNHPLAFLTDAQQNRVVADLERARIACMLHDPDLMAYFDRGQVTLNPPLLRYMRENFEPAATHGRRIILRRRAAPG